MPRVSPHAVKSAIRLLRQSTTVPNTSNTRALTAEISDMLAPGFYFVIPPQDQTRNSSRFPDSMLRIAPE